MISDLEEFPYIQVDVTREDLDNGIRKHPCNCPLALALKRALREHGADFHEVRVDGANFEDVHVFSYGRDFRFEYPEYCNPDFNGIEEFVFAFDREEFCVPFSFRVSFYDDTIVED